MLSSLALGLHMGLTTALPMPAALVALGDTTQFELDRYTRRIEADGGWWLEVENQLLVAAPMSRYPALVAGRSVVADLGFVRPDDFALQSRSCGIEAGEQHPALVKAGRFSLVRIDANTLPFASPEISEWKPVVPNQVLARDVTARGLATSKGGTDPEVQLRVDAVDRDRWFGVLGDLATYDRNSRRTGIADARDYLIGKFNSLGLTTTTQPFSMGTVAVPQVNVVGTLTGNLFPDEWIVVGAHYDSIQFNGASTAAAPGAEDNASGCAAVVEMAEVFTRFPPNRTMIFVCFSGEEQNLYGSKAFVQNLHDDNTYGKVKLALIMDMIGYSADTVLDVQIETTTAIGNGMGVFQRFRNATPSFAPELNLHEYTSPFGSDHMPFIQHSPPIPSLLVIEYDWDIYPGYHKTTDVPGNITNALDMGGGVLKMNAAVLTEAAGYDAVVLFGNGFE